MNKRFVSLHRPLLVPTPYSVTVWLALLMSGCNGGANPVDSFLNLGGGSSGAGVGDSAVSFSPTSLDFGAVYVGMVSSDRQITLRNNFDRPITIKTVVKSSPHLEIVSETCTSLSALNPGATCIATGRFAPTAGISLVTTLEIGYSIAEQATPFRATLGMSGLGVAPIIFAGISGSTAKTHNRITVNWPLEPLAQSFHIYNVVAGSPIFLQSVTNSGGSVVSSSIVGLSPSTTYNLRVRAIDALGSPDANTVNFSETTNANQAPSIASLGSLSIPRGGAFSFDAVDQVTGNDLDADGDAITYTCRYDLVVDGSVSGSAPLCSSLTNENGSNASFASTNGVFNWSPPYALSLSSQYEFQVSGADVYGGTNSRIAVGTVVAGPPGVPTGLAAIPGNSQVTLNWTATPTATQYTIRRNTVSGGASSGTVLTASETGTSFVDSGVTNGVVYYYTIRAENSGGASAYAGEISTTPFAPLAAPTGVTISSGDGYAAPTWSAVTGATLYTVKRSTTAGSGYTALSTSVSTTSYTDITALNGTTYYYVIAATNAWTASGNSAEVSATPVSLPTAPTALSVSVASMSSLTLSWIDMATNEISYTLERSLDGTTFGVIAALPPNSQSFTHSGLTLGTTYYYRVYATNSSGSSARSNVGSGTPGYTLPNLSSTPVATDRVFPSSPLEQGNTLTYDYFDVANAGDGNIALGYTCTFDLVVDGVVSAGASCGTLPGTASFNTSSGLFAWTPNATTYGAFEILVTGSNSLGTDTEIRVVNVRAPYLTGNLLVSLDADFASDQKKAPTNTPFSTTWTNLLAAGTAFDGMLTGFGTNGSVTSGWTGDGTSSVTSASTGPRRLAFDGINDRLNLGTGLNSQGTLLIDLWARPANQTQKDKILFTNADATRGITLKQSGVGLGQFSVVIGNNGNSYSDEIMSDAPRLYYRMNEGTGLSRIVDSSGNNQHALWTNGIGSHLAGALPRNSDNRALRSSETGGLIDTRMPSSLNHTQSFTLEGWIKTNSADGVYHVLFSSLAASNVYQGIELAYNDSLMNFYIMNNYGAGHFLQASAPTPTKLNDNQWHHLAVTYNGNSRATGATLYMDGVALTTTTGYYDGLSGTGLSGAQPCSTSTTFKIGRRGSDTWATSDAQLDELALYTTALSASRIQAHYNAKNVWTAEANMPLIEDSWNHLGIEYNHVDGALRIIHNGSARYGLITAPGLIVGSGVPFTIGADAAGNKAWAGEVAEFRAYSSGLYSDLTTNHNATVGRYAETLPIMGLLQQLQADRIVEYVSGEDIAVWTDSSYFNHMQRDAGGMPNYFANQINGHSVVRFFQGDYLIGWGSTLRTTLGGFAHYAVVQRSAAQVAASSTQWQRVYSSSTRAVPTCYDFSCENWTTYPHGYDASGAPIALAPSIVYATGNNHAIANMTLGASARNNPPNSEFFTGDVAESLLYDRQLTAAEQARVVHYLRRRYGITAPVTGFGYAN